MSIVPELPPLGLAEFLDEHLGAQFGLLEEAPLEDSGPATRRLHSLTGSEKITRPLAAAAFWQSFLGSSEFATTLNSLGASPLTLAHGQAFIVRHGEGGGRQDLIVFDPGLQPARVLATDVLVTDTQLREGWTRFQGWTTPLASSASFLEADVALEANRRSQFGLVVVRTPQIEWTGPPSAPADIRVTKAQQPFSSVGVVATYSGGHHGVTGALHATGPIGTNLWVAGVKGTVRSVDGPTDSCFIECDQVPPVGLRGANGPLRGRCPGNYDVVTFQGAGTVSLVQTLVTALSPELPVEIPGFPPKLLTDPVTVPGDSGAALTDDNGHVLGFALYRTGFNQRPAFSAWIWASSVYQALGIM